MNSEVILGDLQRRVIGMLRMGVIDGYQGNKAIINFGEESVECGVLVPNESIQILPGVGDQVLAVFPYGDMTCGYVMGALSEEPVGPTGDVLIKTKGKVSIEASQIEWKTSTENLISLICDALQVIATSTTVVNGAPVPSLENQSQLPALISRLKGMSS